MDTYSTQAHVQLADYMNGFPLAHVYIARNASHLDHVKLKLLLC